MKYRRREFTRAASPHALLPLGVPQLIPHGIEDDAVPIEISRRYAHAALCGWLARMQHSEAPAAHAT